MKQRRRTDNIYDLCNGSAKLAEAFGITTRLDCANLIQGSVSILSMDSYSENYSEKIRIITSPRIGVFNAQHLRLRFSIKNNRFASR